jgi:ferrochelatase
MQGEMTALPDTPPVDAVLVLSFGGPEHPDDVMPFLRNVTRGRNVPDDRLAEVAEQYAMFGGRSPINEHGWRLVAALETQLVEHGFRLPVYFGNRNWHPLVADTVAAMADDGIKRAAVFVTSAFGSYSGCRQYQEDMADARAGVGPRAPLLEKLRLFYNHPGFIEPMASQLRSSLQTVADITSTRVVFTAHSIPVSMAQGCDYRHQLEEAAALIADRSGRPSPTYDLVYQSRSGPPQVPWLEPDINDHLRAIATSGVEHVVVVPLGFTSDHMEVLFDLDTQAAQTAAELGLGCDRIPTVGVDPTYVAMIVSLIDEVVNGAAPVALGNDGPWPTPCPPDHCPAPARRPSPG